MSIKIEHGIMRPLYGRGISKDFQKAFEQMSPGDSFTVETRSHRGIALMVAKRRGFKVRSLYMPDEIKVGGKYRIWLDDKPND
jgi:hypothetical protein